MEDLKAISVFDEVEENEDNNVEMTQEEKKEFYRANEDDILKGLLEAVDYIENEDNATEIVIKRKNKEYFRFRIKAVTEEEYNQIRKKHTKYKKNKVTGGKIADEIDAVKYRSELIYRATVEEDRKLIWDNKKVQDKANVLRGIDLVDTLLLAGEKDRVIEVLDRISGYKDEDFEEVAKN